MACRAIAAAVGARFSARASVLPLIPARFFLTLLLLIAATASPAACTSQEGQGMVFSSRLANARPVIKLMASQPSITVTEDGGLAALDPRILATVLGSSLEFDVSRRNYKTPIEIAQVVRSSKGKTQDIKLPQRILDGWNGLKNFINLTVENDNGRTLAMRTITLCPNALNPKLVNQHSPTYSPYPHLCTTADPFQLSMIWGIERNWAIDPTAPEALHPTYPIVLHLTPGRYRVTESIAPSYVRLLGIPASGATASAEVTVKASTSSDGGPVSNAPPPAVTETVRPPVVNPGSLKANSPEDSLPELVAQPAWGIGITSTSGTDYLGFGATIWVNGNGPLDIEGFRSARSADMKAYQYFWHNGRIVGAVPVGTIEFDSQMGHGHWHFQQFAQYRLLNAAKRPVNLSLKTGFCIAPSDPIDLLSQRATWSPSSVGFASDCDKGRPNAQSVGEMLPVGWGDTYTQAVAGQAFNITGLPNGVYYVEIVANPLGALRVLSSNGGTSYRMILIGGTKAHRTVMVPAWNEIDYEP